MSSDIISVRVRRQIKQEAVRLGIDMRSTVEDALEKAIEEKKERAVQLAIEEIKREMKGVSEDQWMKSLRESRNRRKTTTT